MIGFFIVLFDFVRIAGGKLPAASSCSWKVTSVSLYGRILLWNFEVNGMT